MKNKRIHPYVQLVLFGIITGILVGFAQTIFYYGMELIFEFRHGKEMALFYGLPLAGLFIVYLFQNFDIKRNFGMNLLFHVDQKREDDIPLVMAPLMIVATWITHFFGGSVGREGVAVQVGSTIAHWLKNKTDAQIRRSTVLMTGVSAGFAGLFGTPFAAILFALEIFHAGTVRIYGCIPVAVASFTSAGVTYCMGMRKSHFVLDSIFQWDLLSIFKLAILGIFFRMLGWAFSTGMHKAKHAWAHVHNPYYRIFIGGLLVAILMMITSGRYANLGEDLIHQAILGDQILPWDFLLKMGLTILTLSCGFHGGEVMPLFAIGSTFGYVLAPIFGLPPHIGAALGYCALFGAGTNTFFAPMILSVEAFGPSIFIPIIIVSTISYLCNLNASIYPYQQVKKYF